jgi:hypothetical protein
VTVVFEGREAMVSVSEEKKEVGRAMSTTPIREMRDAY